MHDELRLNGLLDSNNETPRSDDFLRVFDDLPDAVSLTADANDPVWPPIDEDDATDDYGYDSDGSFGLDVSSRTLPFKEPQPDFIEPHVTQEEDLEFIDDLDAEAEESDSDEDDVHSSGDLTSRNPINSVDASMSVANTTMGLDLDRAIGMTDKILAAQDEKTD